MSDLRAWVPDEAVEKLTVRRALVQDEDPVKMATEIIKENLPIAAMAMAHLAINSQTEMVRLNAAKYLMDRAFDPKGKLPDAKPAWDKVFESTMVEIDNALGGGE